MTQTGCVSEIPELVDLRLASMHEEDEGSAYGEYRGYLRAVSKLEDVPVPKLDNIVNQIANLCIIER